VDDLVDALRAVAFWFQGRELRFGTDGVGQVILQHRSGGVVTVVAARREPPDGLVVRWACAGGVADLLGPSELRQALALPVFEDTRKRRAHEGVSHGAALFRFARCGEPAHRGAGGYRVRCEGCLAELEAARAQGEEQHLYREAVRMLQEMSAQDAREGG
jgi:hypothetical protein